MMVLEFEVIAISVIPAAAQANRDNKNPDLMD
jgi:hypothetical protein